MRLPSGMYWFADGTVGIVPNGFIWFLNKVGQGPFVTCVCDVEGCGLIADG